MTNESSPAGHRMQGSAWPSPRRLASTVLIVAMCVLAGCATTGKSVGQRQDPWENWNRKVFAFNEGLDENVLKPVATAYSKVVPQKVRLGVDNFFGNAADVWSAVNSFLQLKFGEGFHGVMRVGSNTLFGVGGVLDFATDMGLERTPQDFGKTLAHYGVGAGPYIVWPLYGPSTVRDSIALPLDRSASPAVLINDGAAVTALTALQIVNTRAAFLPAGRVLDDIVLDKYTFIRDAYLQRRGVRLFGDDAYPDDDSYAKEPPPPK